MKNIKSYLTGFFSILLVFAIGVGLDYAFSHESGANLAFLAGLGVVGTVASAAKSFFSGFTKEARAERKAVREQQAAAKVQAVSNIASNIKSGAAAANPDILVTKLGGTPANPAGGNLMATVANIWGKYKKPILIVGGLLVAYKLFMSKGSPVRRKRRATPKMYANLAKARAAKKRKAAARR
jgi:NADH:ubiquinone oxidoreductase subunit 5 (subunit L)/multisubunit Na+/H+ antiporter MnhA subunit